MTSTGQNDERRLVDYGRKYYKEHNYNCAETLIHAANEYYGLGMDDNAMRMMAGFGGGMFTGHLCGALVGAQAALSLMVCKDRAHEELDVVRPACQRLVRNFNNAYQATDCKDIKGRYHTKEEKCWPTVRQACEVLEATVSELHLAEE